MWLLIAAPTISASWVLPRMPTAITAMSHGISSPSMVTDSTRSLPPMLSMPLPNSTRMPSRSSSAITNLPISGSRSRGNGGGVRLVTATSSPLIRRATATSRPTAPPPTTTALFFFEPRAASRRAQVSSMLEQKCTPLPTSSFAPGIGKFTGLAPWDRISAS